MEIVSTLIAQTAALTFDDTQQLTPSLDGPSTGQLRYFGQFAPADRRITARELKPNEVGKFQR
ncbi:hypothetical protein GGQ85_003742 [Nitrobacter vulgaris]|jgi:hypothetical protein|uniref:hypothetical protein n=1 Tax=Nitrobacter vulgaris TaxID=29421 RepID=UPI00285D9CA8|nr:hypothetical protein [Nitrobacter vulgaris]MDR6306014.1 hypothetical protein [Nitrobacter vulgaris]